MLQVNLGVIEFNYGRVLEKSKLTSNCEGDILAIEPLSDNTYAIKCVFDHYNYEVYLTLEVELSELLWCLSAEDYKTFNVLSITVDNAINTYSTSKVPKKQLIKDLQEDYEYDAQFSIKFS